MRAFETNTHVVDYLAARFRIVDYVVLISSIGFKAECLLQVMHYLL